MKKVLFLILSAIVLCPHLVLGIGRAGNGTSVVDSELGFQTLIPKRYYGTYEFPDQSLKVYAPGFRNEIMSEDYLQFVPESSFFLEIANMGRDEANQWKREHGGISNAHSDPCVDFHMYESINLTYGSAQWGVGKGVVVYAPLNADSKQTVLSVLKSLKLDPGACEWK